ncbi:MAG TPA: hypothetical protein VNE71_04665, partial [Myxococcota bacterium]|nr:hypothetical protein [Myxococcota bacterium]
GRADAGYRVWIARRGAQPLAAAAYRRMVLRGIPAAFLLDLVAGSGEAAAARELLRGAAACARAEGACVLSALRPGSGPARDALRSAGFVPVPEALHPQVIRYSVRGLGRFAGDPRLADPRAWSLAWSDTDVV